MVTRLTRFQVVANLGLHLRILRASCDKRRLPNPRHPHHSNDDIVGPSISLELVLAYALYGNTHPNVGRKVLLGLLPLPSGTVREPSSPVPLSAISML